MRASRRSLAVVLIAIVGVAAVVTVTIVAAGRHGAGDSHWSRWTRLFHKGPPKVVVDKPKRQLGTIDMPDEFVQEFVFRNEGDSPLQLAAGPSSCSCTATDLPERPIPPGGQATVHVGLTDATKHDTLKSGSLSRRMTVLTNDPNRPRVVLQMDATVVHRLLAQPADMTLSLQTSELSSETKHRPIR